MKELLDIAMNKADDAEVFSVKLEKYPVSFRGNKLKSIKSQLGRSISLRVNVNGKLGFSSDSNIDNPEEFVDRAINTAPMGPDCPYQFCKSEYMTAVDLFDPKTVTIDVEDSVEMGYEILGKILKKAPGTHNDLDLVKEFFEITYVSGDAEKTYYKTLFSYDMTNFQVREDGFIYIEEYDSSCKFFEDFDPPIDRLIDKINLSGNAFEMPSKKLPVIFHPKAVRQLLNSLTMGLSGTYLVSGTSPLAGKMKEKIVDEKFSLTDDGTIPFGSGSKGFDGEGIPSGKLKLFKRGVLTNYLLDLNSAYKLDMEPNGCAGRGLDSPPTPSSSNLVVATGDVPLEDMIKNIKEGILVESVIGGGQANVIAGEFSLNVSLGFLIKNGEMTGIVRNTMIAGNTYDMLRDNLEAVGDKAIQMGSISSPYLMFSDVSISGKE